MFEDNNYYKKWNINTDNVSFEGKVCVVWNLESCHNASWEAMDIITESKEM